MFWKAASCLCSLLSSNLNKASGENMDTDTELAKLLYEYENRKVATKEERAINLLLKTVIAQQHRIKELEDKTRIKW